MRVRVFLVLAIAVLGAQPSGAQAGSPAPSSAVVMVSAATPTTLAEPPPSRPPVTVNEFLPDNRGLGECISSVPRPGCGSEARGGWHQTLVFLAIFAGLGLIGWRIVAGARNARREQTLRS